MRRSLYDSTNDLRKIVIHSVGEGGPLRYTYVSPVQLSCSPIHEMSSKARRRLCFIAIDLVTSSVLILVAFFPLATAAQDTEPKLNPKERREFATRLLNPLRKQALANPKLDERMFLTKYYAALDPNWTAKFILDNPLPGNSPMFDHDAILTLMKNSNSIGDDHLLDVLRQSHIVMFCSYVATAIKNLAPQSSVREKIIHLAIQRGSEIQGDNLWSITELLRLAKVTGNETLLAKSKTMLAEYYESGKATEAFEAMRKMKNVGPSDLNYHAGQLARFAPNELKSKISKEFAIQKSEILIAMLRDDLVSDEEKIIAIKLTNRFHFGADAEEQMTNASLLANVAQFDLDRAIRWSETAPSTATRIWSQLIIAPQIAKRDQRQATKIVDDCYVALATLDQSGYVPSNYNFPPVAIASSGLDLVKLVDPNLLAACIDKTVSCAQSTRTMRTSNAQTHLFNSVVAIAKYDFGKAKKLFEQHSDDVQLHSSPAVF